MPTYEIHAPDGRTLSVDGPTPPTEADLDEIFKASGSRVTKPATVPATAAVLSTVPSARVAAEHLATSPRAWKAGKAIGELLGFGGGLARGSLTDAAAGSWLGGKAGWRLTNLAQRLALPAAKALAKLEPYSLPMAALSAEGDALTRLNNPDDLNRIYSLLGLPKPKK